MTVQFNNVDSLVAAYCKATKASKAKTMEFVSQLAQSAIVEAVQGAERGFIDRTKPESYTIRKYVEEHSEELSKKQMTNKELADILGIDQYHVSNNIEWMKKHKGNIQYVGFGEKEKGVRGRKPRLWTVVVSAKAE